MLSSETWEELTSEALNPAILSEFAYNLTVAARGGYIEPFGAERLRRFNEIQHVVLAQVSSLVASREAAFPAAALGPVLLETAGEDPLGTEIQVELRSALHRAVRLSRSV